jgi:membrane-bound metal-dependent hydrolase YbcI (DUF457 family)
MPITPFHLGPGLALYGMTRRADFWAFTAANVIIDVESIGNILRGARPVHTFLHSYAGASLTILPAAFVGYLVWRVLVRRGRADRTPGAIALLVGAALGAWSHVVLDSIMHLDMRPLAPWSDTNPLLRAIPVWALHVACGVLVVVGAVLVLRRRHKRRGSARFATSTTGRK